MPYLKHIPTLWLYSISSIKANSYSLLDKSYKKTTKYFQNTLKTDSKLSNVIKLRNDGFEGNTKNVLLFFLWKTHLIN